MRTIPGRRRRIALPAALLALALLAPSAAGADTAQVTVVSPGGSQQTLSLQALAGSEDVSARSYTLRSASGESKAVVSGFSLAKLIDAAGADPYTFTYLEVQRPTGGSVQLSRHQALDPSAFPEGPPVVYPTATGTAFLRPATGSGDLNASDSFESPQGISIVLRKGSPLKVRAEASKAKVKVGQQVDFSAIVEGGGAGEELAYSWYFDDGTRRVSGESVSHSFSQRGTYDVTVGVTTPGDSAGTSAVVSVQVGEPQKGPNRKGGGTNKNSKAPDHGSADGTGDGVPGDQIAGVPPAAVVPPTTLPPSTVSPVPAPPPTPVEPPVEPTPPPTAPPTGETVSGTLLTTGAPAAPEEPTDTEAARTGTLSASEGDGDSGGGPGLPATGLGALFTVGLLGFGALAEARGGFISNLSQRLPRR